MVPMFLFSFLPLPFLLACNGASIGLGSIEDKPPKQNQLSQEQKKPLDLSLLLDHMEILVWYLLDEETYGGTNKAHAQFLSLKKDALEGKKVWDLFSKEEARLCIKGNQQVFQEKRPIKGEEWVRNGKGEKRLLSIIKTPILNSSKEVLSVICSAQDITDKWKVQQELKKSEERLRAIIEDQTELICRFKPGGILTFVNEAYCKYFQRSREELLGKSFMPLIPPSDQGISERHVSSLTYKEPVTNYEHQVILPGGEIRWQHWTDRAIFNQKKEIIEYQAVGRDITQQKEAEEALKKAHVQLENRVKERTRELLKVNQALREEIKEHQRTGEMLAAEKERLAVTLSSIGDGIISTSNDGLIEMINSQALAITGWTQEDVMGRRIEEVFSLENCGDSLNLLASTRGDANEVKILFRKDGKKRFIHERSSPIKDKEGMILGYVVVFSDITDKIRDDEKKVLSKKLASIGQLAAGIAHEINTPLHYIQENLIFLEESFKKSRKLFLIT